MAWCRQAPSQYLGQYWPSPILPYVVTRPRWLNSEWTFKHALRCSPQIHTISEQIMSWPMFKCPQTRKTASKSDNQTLILVSSSSCFHQNGKMIEAALPLDALNMSNWQPSDCPVTSSLVSDDNSLVWNYTYRKISNIRRTKSPNLNVSRLVLQLSLPNPMKPGVKSRMKM